MKQFNPFQFLAPPQVIVDSVIVFCEAPHVTMSSLCVLSNVRTLHCVLINPSVSLHSLMASQSSSMSPCPLTSVAKLVQILSQNLELSSVLLTLLEADLRRI